MTTGFDALICTGLAVSEPVYKSSTFIISHDAYYEKDRKDARFIEYKCNFITFVKKKSFVMLCEMTLL